MKRITITIIIILLSASLVHPSVWANGLCKILIPEQCEDNIIILDTTKSLNVGSLQIQAATAFLAANTAYQKFQERYEISTLNDVFYSTPEQTEAIENAIGSITAAEELLLTLYVEFQKYRLNTTLIEKMKTFDYKCFSEKYHLNGTVIAELEESLSRGDIYGVLRRFVDKAGEIRRELEALKPTVDKNEPNIDAIYIVNQLFADMSLYGQYAAMIFRETQRTQ